MVRMIPYNKNYLKCLSCLFLEYSCQYFQVPVDHKKPKPLEVKLWLRRDCYTAQPLSQWNCVLQLPIPPGTARLGSRQTPGLHVLRPLPSSHSFPYSLESTSPASRETELLTVHASTMPGTGPLCPAHAQTTLPARHPSLPSGSLAVSFSALSSVGQ